MKKIWNEIEFYPTARATSESAILLGSSLVLFSSPELSQFTALDNIAAGGGSHVIGFGILKDSNIKLVENGTLWDFVKNGEPALISSKMNFNPEIVNDTFTVSVAIASALNPDGSVKEALEIQLSKYVPTHSIRMLLFLRFH